MKLITLVALVALSYTANAKVAVHNLFCAEGFAYLNDQLKETSNDVNAELTNIKINDVEFVKNSFGLCSHLVRMTSRQVYKMLDKYNTNESKAIDNSWLLKVTLNSLVGSDVNRFYFEQMAIFDQLTLAVNDGFINYAKKTEKKDNNSVRTLLDELNRKNEIALLSRFRDMSNHISYQSQKIYRAVDSLETEINLNLDKANLDKENKVNLKTKVSASLNSLKGLLREQEEDMLMNNYSDSYMLKTFFDLNCSQKLTPRIAIAFDMCKSA